MKSIFEKGFTVLSEHLTHSKVRRKLDKIMTLMKQHKRIKRSTLLFYMQMTAWEFDQYIHTLKETGKIIEEQGEKPVRGRTATYYELTDDTINYDEEISMEKV